MGKHFLSEQYERIYGESLHEEYDDGYGSYEKTFSDAEVEEFIRRNEAPFQKGDMVYDKGSKFVSPVLDTYEDGDFGGFRGEVRTAGDGNVNVQRLELYDPERHVDGHIPPSDQDEVDAWLQQRQK